MNFEGQNISLSDALFVDNITGDLESWRIKSEEITRVLVFPPVNNYHRFLIHKVRSSFLRQALARACSRKYCLLFWKPV